MIWQCSHLFMGHTAKVGFTLDILCSSTFQAQRVRRLYTVIIFKWNFWVSSLAPHDLNPDNAHGRRMSFSKRRLWRWLAGQTNPAANGGEHESAAFSHYCRPQSVTRLYVRAEHVSNRRDHADDGDWSEVWRDDDGRQRWNGVLTAHKTPME